MAKQVITANRLADGGVVYRRPDGSWDGSIAFARVDEGDAIAEELERARTETDIVVGAYLIEVDVEGSRILQRSARERIRAAGPSAVLARFGYTDAQAATEGESR